MKALLFIVILWALMSEGGIIRLSSPYFTKMLGGSTTGEAMENVVTPFAVDRASNVSLGTPACYLNHGRLTVGSFAFDWTKVVAEPQSTSAGGVQVSVTLPEVALTLNISDLNPHCTLRLPFYGDVFMEANPVGSANFSWSGPLTWVYPISIANGSLQLGTGGLSGSVAVAGVMGYEGYSVPSHFLFQPFVETWFAAFTENVTTAVTAQIAEIGPNVLEPLLNTAVAVLSDTFLNVCIATVDPAGTMQVTFHDTCETHQVPVRDGLNPATIQVIYSDVSHPEGVEVAPLDGQWSCKEETSVIQWPPGYAVQHNDSYCTTPSEAAWLVDVEDVTPGG